MQMLRYAILISLLIISRVNSHEESGEWSCESKAEIQIQADFKPGLITLDGQPKDWSNIDGSEFSLLPALDPDEDHEYKAGKMTVKALHDGNELFFLVQVDGDYVYTQGENKKCPSVALMFQIGKDATYHNMGGCGEGTDSCTNKTCKGHEVDIMHFSIGEAIPGRLYGGNPIDNREGNGGDRFGHLNDAYSWNPHCRYLDGMGPSVTETDSIAQNDWHGAWGHSSLVENSGFVEAESPYAADGQKGTYYFEFSRPLRTMDRLQQDIQFTIGASSKMSVAFWYPLDGNAWHGAWHYTIGCDWVLLDISSKLNPSNLTPLSKPDSSSNFTGIFALIFSLLALGVSVYVQWGIFRSNKSIPFTPMEDL